jgi:hypothetical protein
MGLRSLLAPETIDAGAARMAGILRAAMGREYEAGRQADFALDDFRKEFDKTPVARGWTYTAGERLPRNYAIMAGVDTGRMESFTPAEQGFVKAMKAQFDAAIDAVQQVSPGSLRDLMEHYMPRIWREPEQNASTIGRLLSHKPWEGPKSFMRQRVLDYFTDGLKMGLKPVSDNPVDVTMQKLGEMYRFATTRRAMADAKATGLRKFNYVYEPMPEGWRAVDDPSSEIFKPPTVTIKEAFDAQMRAKTIDMLQTLGISHERLVKLPGRRWGDAMEGGGIRSKFGGPDFVLWHEAGHMLDWRYPELRDIVNASSTGKAGAEIRALADLRAEGSEITPSYKSYLRSAPEKIANMFDAYVRAPERFKEVAPTVLADLNRWLSAHPEVKAPLDGIKPSLTLGSASAEQFVGGPIKLGSWIMPEGAAQVVDNYLQPGLGRFKAFRSLREVSGLVNGTQLIGFFHGQFVMNDSFYSGLGLSLYDVLNGKPARALKELAQVPVSPVTSWMRGRKINAAIEDPAAATAEYRKIAQLAVETNLRAGAGNYDPQYARQWKRAFNEVRAEPSVGAAWETFYRAPLAAIQTALAPVMHGLVPPMKLGIFARMAERVMEDNPGISQNALRAKLAEASNATEDRLGQVTYDNQFQHRAIKDAMQLALRAYGWQLTKYRMILGGAGDWAAAAKAVVTGKPANVTYRMTYLPAMVAGHALIGGTLQYLLTGKPPQGISDYLFPETNLLDKYGRPVRVAVADFVKDVAADWRSFPNINKMGAEWSRKLAPFWNMAAEMYQNRDYWGTQIFSKPQVGDPELDHLMKNLWEGVQYLGNAAKPFSISGGQKFVDAGASKTLGYAAPMVGFVPAPRYATQTPMQSYISDTIGDSSYSKTKEETAASRAAVDVSNALRQHKPLTSEQLKTALSLTDAKLRNAITRASLDPDVWALRALDLDRGMKAFDLANEDERKKISPLLWHKLDRAYVLGGHERDTLKRYVKLLMPYVPAASR